MPDAGTPAARPGRPEAGSIEAPEVSDVAAVDTPEPGSNGAGDEVGRAQRRRDAAQRLGDDAPREGVDIIRPVERALVVGVRLAGRSDTDVASSLDELALLIDTAGGAVVDRVTQRRDRPDAATYIGRGKIDDLRDLVGRTGVDAVVFDDELTPAQQRTLEEALGVKVLDRTIVILDIFAQHAASREGMLQVELAQLTYLLSRLRGWGRALSRQAGGIGTRGPGESQLEVDRRRIARRITRLRADLGATRRTRALKHRRRERAGVPVVALVGYTNAGKSTLLNRLTGATVGVADQLFATVDTTARRVRLPDGRVAVATDTVGFIQNLPTQLVEAFRSTLEQTLDANLLLHVCDGSHPRVAEQIAAVDRVLDEIGATELPRLLVVNKIDRVGPAVVDRLKRSNGVAVAVSASTGEGIDGLLDAVSAHLPAGRRVIEALVPYDHAALVALAHRDGSVMTEEHRPDGTYVVASVGRRAAASLAPYLVEPSHAPPANGA